MKRGEDCRMGRSVGVGGVWGVGGQGLVAGGESPGDGPSLVWLL